MSSQTRRILLCTSCLVILLTGLLAASTSAAELPSTVKMWLREIDIQIGKARGIMTGERDLPTSNSDVWFRKLKPYVEREAAYHTADEQAHFDLKSTIEFIHKMMDEDIKEKYRGQISLDHPDIKAADEKIAAIDKEARDFLDKPPSDQKPPDKELIEYATDDLEKLKAQKLLCEEAEAVYTEYEQVQFPEGRSSDLRRVDGKLRDRIKAFPKVLDDSITMILKNAESKVASLETALGMSKDWRSKPYERPTLMDAGSVKAANDAASAVATLLPPDDARMASLNKRLDAINKECADRRTAFAERTLMRGDKYKGKDITTLKSLAKSIVMKKHPGAQILRVTIPSATWGAESVIEATDTTNTALQHRYTQDLTAEVCARVDGQVYLYTLNLNKNKIGGKWGPLQGHIMFTDPMLEKNVNRTKP